MFHSIISSILLFGSVSVWFFRFFGSRALGLVWYLESLVRFWFGSDNKFENLLISKVISDHIRVGLKKKLQIILLLGILFSK